MKNTEKISPQTAEVTPTQGYSLYIDTLCDGTIPVEFDETDKPVVYPTLEAAQLAVAEYAIERLQQFLAGERDFDDAMNSEEYIDEAPLSESALTA